MSWCLGLIGWVYRTVDASPYDDALWTRRRTMMYGTGRRNGGAGGLHCPGLIHGARGLCFPVRACRCQGPSTLNTVRYVDGLSCLFPPPLWALCGPFVGPLWALCGPFVGPLWAVRSSPAPRTQQPEPEPQGWGCWTMAVHRPRRRSDRPLCCPAAGCRCWKGGLG